jgi:hypothetical protein
LSENNKENEMSSYEEFANKFWNSYVKFQEMINKSGLEFYNPIYANSALKRFNTLSTQPTVEHLISWLKNPRYYEQELHGCSDWLFSVSQFYQRTLVYCANILNFDYELIPLNPPDPKSNKKTLNLYLKQKDLNNDWLRRFRIKEQFVNVTLDVMKSGGKYYYLRHSDYSDYLQAMPDDYCYINGRVDTVGYTYSMNMAFFYQFPESISGFAPEFASWYQEFLDKQNKENVKSNPYRIMPSENAVVFKFDDTRPEIIPPFSGVFKNALEIEEYQDLLKLKAQLDTFQIMYLKIPIDKDTGKPLMSHNEAAEYTAVAQSQVPTGVGVVCTPMDESSTKFNDSQNMNNIIGLGAKNYYEASGLTPALFGSDTKSSTGILNSIKTDFLTLEPMYNQYERFINYQLSKIQGKYNFAIRFLRRSNFELDADKKYAQSLLTSGLPVSRVLSSDGLEPWMHRSYLIDGTIEGFNDMLNPPQTSFTMSKGNSGAPTAEDKGEPISDSNDITRAAGSNNDKFSKKACLNCGKDIDENSEFSEFCNTDCMKEYLENNEG